MVFSEKKNVSPRAKRRGTGFHESAVTILTSGCHFNGKLYCKGSSRIGGKIEGEIISEGLLIIEEEALITAKIQAEEVVIQGQIRGEVEASFRVELSSSGQVEGDIITPSLVIHEGATFNGRTTMRLPEEREEKLITAAPLIEKPMKKDIRPRQGYKDNKVPEIPEIGVG
ncbi:MAG: polymer-forming cytoskeletal protein [Deltaproteobacteria bacterium]|nr:polymer-forming cytoskeletal protein [Deltaproteobacteria bacterium]